MTVLDTNVLIRFFTKDNISQFKLVEKLLKSRRVVFIPDVVFAEIYYILIGHYQANRDDVVKIFNFLTQTDNIKSNEYMKKAVFFFEKTNLSVADCIIAAQVGEKDNLASFDKKLLNQGKVENYWKV